MAENNQLNALLVRHIGDLEAAVKHVKTSVDKRLWTEAADLLQERVDKGLFARWHDVEREDVSFSPRSWLCSNDEADGADAWLGLDSVADEGIELDETWLARFLSAGPCATKMALYFDQKVLSTAQAKRLFKSNSQFIDALLEAGFVHNAGEGTLFVPFTFHAETLAKAFEDDDFTAAFAPLAEALDKAAAALPLLDRLVTAARQAAG